MQEFGARAAGRGHLGIGVGGAGVEGLQHRARAQREQSLGRSAVRHGVTAGHSSAEALFTLGARAVVQALEAGAADADPEVAAACRARAELLLRFAAPQ